MAKHCVDGSLNRSEVFGNPNLEFAACYGNPEVQPSIMEAEFRGLVLRKGELHPLHCLMQLVSKILFHNGNESFDLFGLQRAYARAPEDLTDIVCPQEREIVPPFEVGIDPCWNRGKNLVQRSGFGVRPQGGGNQFANNAPIEGIAGKADTAIAKHVSAVAAFPRRGSDTQQGEVAGAAAEIPDQDEFVMIER